MWPLVIYHKMDKFSPLYNLDPEHLDKESFETIVKVGGVRSESGGTIFGTSSYTNNEINWGQVIIASSAWSILLTRSSYRDSMRTTCCSDARRATRRRRPSTWPASARRT